jgi:hypothetical protein
MDVPRANGYVAQTIDTWITSKNFLKKSLEEHKVRVQEMKEQREACLDTPGVQEYMKAECTDGKNVRIDGCDDAFTLRYSESVHRRPILEKHLQDAIQHAINTSVRDVTRIPSFADVANLIMDTALELAGEVCSDSFTLSAKSGRKRAVDGSIK